jgi:hypothetical protein
VGDGVVASRLQYRSYVFHRDLSPSPDPIRHDSVWISVSYRGVANHLKFFAPILAFQNFTHVSLLDTCAPCMMRTVTRNDGRCIGLYGFARQTSFFPPMHHSCVITRFVVCMQAQFSFSVACHNSVSQNLAPSGVLFFTHNQRLPLRPTLVTTPRSYNTVRINNAVTARPNVQAATVHHRLQLWQHLTFHLWTPIRLLHRRQRRPKFQECAWARR